MPCSVVVGRLQRRGGARSRRCAACIESVIVSAYMMTRPFTLRAARPDVWISAPRRAQEAFLVGVENGDQRHFGQVEPFAQQVDADQHVEHAAAQVAQDLDALERVDVRVQVADLDAQLLVVRASGPRPSAWSASSPARARLRSARSRISCSRSSTWPLHRPHLDRRIHQAGRPDHLLDDHAARLRAARTGPASPRRRPAGRRAAPTPRSSAAGCRAPTAGGSRTRPALPCATGRRDTCRGPAARSGGSRRRRPARPTAGSRAASAAAAPGGAAGQVARVVLDAVAVADLLDHLEVEHRPLVQPLGLEHLALALELAAALARARP